LSVHHEEEDIYRILFIDVEELKAK